jgi:hypothetical protein
MTKTELEGRATKPFRQTVPAQPSEDRLAAGTKMSARTTSSEPNP